MKQLGSHLADFNEILYWVCFEKSVEKIKIPLKSDKNNGVLVLQTCALVSSYLAQFHLLWEMFQTEVVDKLKTRILCSFFFYSRSVYDITWKNIVKPDRPHLTIWSICIACCIRKDTNTPSEYVILTAFPLQQWLRERASVLPYAYTACTATAGMGVHRWRTCAWASCWWQRFILFQRFFVFDAFVCILGARCCVWTSARDKKILSAPCFSCFARGFDTIVQSSGLWVRLHVVQGTAPVFASRGEQKL